MRLTLRTLLAYLDDILEPAQAKEIGEKIAESPVASELAGRIREILRRRRITAPQISGPGSGPDPNLTAEYLDNTLSAEAVTEFEQICLESDVHLAEVAACHQILTLVLGEPADVSNELRERMYALGAVAAAETVTGEPAEPALAASGGASPDDQSNSTASGAAISGQPGSFEAGLPPQLRRRSLASRAVPAAIVLICVGWGALIYLDPHLWDRSTPPEDGTGALAAANVVEDDVEIDGGQSTPEPGSEEVPVEMPEPEPGVEDQADSTTPAEMSAVEPGDDPDTETTTDSTEVAVADPDAGEAETPSTPPQPDPNAFQPPAEPAPPVDVVSMLYNSPDGILLQRNGETGEWTVMPRRALLHAGNEIACPEPFTARLQIDDGVCLVTLMGGARVKLTGANEAGPFGFELIRGRVGVFRTSSDPVSDEPVAFGVRVGDQLYHVQLTAPDTWCGFDLAPPQPYGRTQPPQAEHAGGGIFVARGAVRVIDPATGASDLRPEIGWRTWAANDAGAQPLLAVPNWLSPSGPTLPAVYRTYANLYEPEFPIDQPVWQSIPAIVRDRRPKLSEFAVETLSVTQNFRELVRALKAEHEESRLAAIVGLREWLPRNAENSELLRGELGMTFRDDDAAAIEELLWGYSVDDGRDADISARLVGWLGSGDVAVRELALFHIKMLTGRDNDFHPTASMAQRDAAIGRWEEFLRRNGSLVRAE